MTGQLFGDWSVRYAMLLHWRRRYLRVLCERLSCSRSLFCAREPPTKHTRNTCMHRACRTTYLSYIYECGGMYCMYIYIFKHTAFCHTSHADNAKHTPHTLRRLAAFVQSSSSVTFGTFERSHRAAVSVSLSSWFSPPSVFARSVASRRLSRKKR